MVQKVPIYEIYNISFQLTIFENLSYYKPLFKCQYSQTLLMENSLETF